MWPAQEQTKHRFWSWRWCRGSPFSVKSFAFVYARAKTMTELVPKDLGGNQWIAFKEGGGIGRSRTASSLITRAASSTASRAKSNFLSVLCQLEDLSIPASSLPETGKTRR
jgi:hypothetical protein